MLSRARRLLDAQRKAPYVGSEGSLRAVLFCLPRVCLGGEISFLYAETALRLQEIFNKSRKIEEFETKDRVTGITTANFS